MELSELMLKYQRHAGVRALRKVLGAGTAVPVYLEGLQGSAPALVLAAACDENHVLMVMNDEDEAGYLYSDLSQLLGTEVVLFFPSAFRRGVKYGQPDAANEILRTEVLSRLSSVSAGPILVVTYPDALSVKVAPKAQVEANSISVRVGQNVDMTWLEHRLVDLGMRRTDYVYEPGDFAVRGSILDVYSYAGELPLRIDFFGDEVDSIRTFSIESQLSEEKLSEATIIPEMSVVDGQRVSLFNFLPDDTLLVSHGLGYVADVVRQTFKAGFSAQAQVEREAGASEASEVLSPDMLLLSGEDFEREAGAFVQIVVGTRPERTKGTRISFHTSPQPLFHKNFELLSSSLADSAQEGYGLYVLADSPKQHERLCEILQEMRPHLRFEAVERTLHAGFRDEDLRICLYTDHQVFDRFHKYQLRSDRARTGKVALTLKEVQQFEPGDFIVHVDHGIGQFAGLVHVEQGAAEQEMMKLVYQGGDVVYVSIHSLNKVSKYKGRDGQPPKLSRLGTGAWEKMKDRTKKKIKDIARDLIQLYSQRRSERGFAFSPDGYMQHELEASFLYEDTPDQLRVTQEVKKDMESQRPMDRLVCGDVGFGKTEIAIRAAFKAATDGKQVAVLVPTTVLAYQHYQTFSQRLKNFPVTVDYLSRARSAEKTRQIRESLKSGRTEIIIGTHKLISKTIEFHDLGLLIIDEEQKFGVATKEKLRQMRVNVDTLTLSATPIPRTLQFSLMGARDLSVLQTPPPNRYPIHTEVHPFGHEVIADAVNFEMSRNGQVFIVCNRIAKLGELDNLLRKHVPDARVAIGHGQMPPEKLEQIIMDFINYDYDVLLSTTIVENGIHIPNANTIIIDGANNFGQSDLHQMRGRVGRSNRKAFCYLLAPPLSLLPPDARRRLEAIENFSDLGSGIHIAMQDLDIRGAGNLLGAEQSGFIADLGYETYQKILSEAVSELKTQEFSQLYADEAQEKNELRGDLFVDDCVLDSDLPLYLSETYIPGSAERMACYRELDGLKTEAEVATFRSRMEDRFGPMPAEGLDLLQVVVLRQLGRQLGIERLLLRQGQLALYFVSNPDSAFYQSTTFGRSLSFLQSESRRCSLGEVKGRRRMVVKGITTIEEAVSLLRQIASQPSV
ncbi:MAG: transcription-repair coupling factor [Bacteroidaceae bacterium]|nr:transcription-repair coupling factor [Bacteroidaceae bacterium]